MAEKVPVMRRPSSNGSKEQVKRVRKTPSKPGTSTAVRFARLHHQIERLEEEKAALARDVDLGKATLLQVIVQRDDARSRVSSSEKTSQHRLDMIQREVPNFARQVLSGRFDHYRANL